MAVEKPSLFDLVNLVATALLALAGIGVAVVVSRSADHGTLVSTMVSTSTFLLDPDPARQNVGVEIGRSLISEARTDHIVWFERLVNGITDVASVAPSASEAGSDDTPASPPAASPPAPPPPAAPPAAPPPVPQASSVGTRLFDALGGVSPRLFLQVADPGQRAGADALRQALAGARLAGSGQSVIAPGVELVRRPAETFQLRYLKEQDKTEAGALADLLNQELGARPEVVPLKRFFTDPKVKPRTYELWFPHGMAVDVRASAQAS